jgi:protein-S-isoprenylcysteine O-methyltransferase Ste14
MKWTPGLVRAFFIVPFNVLLVIPALILWGTHELKLGNPWDIAFYPLSVGSGALIMILGVWAVIRSVIDLTHEGEEGTPLPWDPPTKFRSSGIYRVTRNPMVSCVSLILLSEALLFGSMALFCWCGFFVTVNLIYIPIVEEPELEKRYGEGYLEYKKRVPRWIPFNIRKNRT